MEIVDAQVHAYERNHPGRPWVGHLQGPASATGDEMVAAMDAVGVDGALLVSPYSLYRYDASYVLEVGAAHLRECGLEQKRPKSLAAWRNSNHQTGQASLDTLRWAHLASRLT